MSKGRDESVTFMVTNRCKYKIFNGIGSAAANYY